MAPADGVYCWNDGQVIKIGMDLTDSFIVVSRMTAILRRYLEYNRFITIESYDLTKNYDLIITKQSHPSGPTDSRLLFKNDLDLEDLAKIRNMIFHWETWRNPGFFVIFAQSPHIF